MGRIRNSINSRGRFGKGFVVHGVFYMPYTSESEASLVGKPELARRPGSTICGFIPCAVYLPCNVGPLARVAHGHEPGGTRTPDCGVSGIVWEPSCQARKFI